MNVDDALRVAGWRYRDRWSVYDLESPAGLENDLDLYWAVTDTADTMVGFVCVEAAARVPGLDADASFIDVGVGMDPDLAGQGRGSAFGEVVLGHLAPADTLRGRCAQRYRRGTYGVCGSQLGRVSSTSAS